MAFSSETLKGKTVLITGAGKGLGEACAQTAYNLGAEVIAVARTGSDLEKLQAKCPSICTWEMDITSKEFLVRLSSLDRLHGLVNNAGTNHVANMEDQPEYAIERVINLNVTSLYYVCQAAILPLKRSGNGSVVNMSSQMGFVGSPGRTLYCMTKHAVEGLTKAMAVELAEENVRVNSVAPTFVDTPLTAPMLENKEFKAFVMRNIPMGQLATKQQVADAVAYLLSDLSSMITGTSLKVDGGWTAQ